MNERKKKAKPSPGQFVSGNTRRGEYSGRCRDDPHPDGGNRAACLGISVEKYNAMTAAYFDVQTENHVATACNVRRSTAKRYIEHGDPARAMPPIKRRFIEAQEKANAKVDRTWADEQVVWKKLILAQKSILADTLNMLNTDKAAREEFVAKLLKSPAMLNKVAGKLLRDESFVYGGPDSRMDLGVSMVDGMSQWTPEELARYAETGEVPGMSVGFTGKHVQD